MGKFNKNGSKEVPELNTSSLPDLIFSILFFFMMVTSMREVTLKVEFDTPKGTEIEKLEKKSLVSYVYIGKPTKEFRAKMGLSSRIQLNDDFAEVGDIRDYIYQEREAMPERDKPFMRVSMKIDQETQMGIVTDVKMALREAWALNVVYSGGKRQ
jgi:biopolymer transport protein ExbD